MDQRTDDGWIRERAPLKYTASSDSSERLKRGDSYPDAGGYRVFFSTDPSLDVVRILETYAVRWGIEVSLREAKQLLGFANSSVRLERAVRRVAPMVDLHMVMRHALDTPAAKILQILRELRMLLGRQDRRPRRAAHGREDGIDRLGAWTGFAMGSTLAWVARVRVRNGVEELPGFSENVPGFPENVPGFPENVPGFPENVFRRTSPGSGLTLPLQDDVSSHPLITPI